MSGANGLTFSKFGSRKFLVEFVDPSSGVDELHLTGEKWMGF
ncbi:MAG: hypothetical protein JPMHGGIA_00813 [Saprospiraceae bacterium]|nr:hypothetical protein [Saprospiraceae bacterium]